MPFLQKLALQEVTAVDTWNQERSPEQIKSFLGRLSENAFSETAEEFEFEA